MQLAFCLNNEVGYSFESLKHWEAVEFVEKWHYSERMPTGENHCYCARIGGEIYAAIVLGIGVNPYQSAFLGVNNCIEIKRLCRREPKENYQLSRLISLSIKSLKKVKNFDAVVAFADPEHSHHGGVYKASGFVRMGTSEAEWHLVDSRGMKRHRRLAHRYSERKGVSVSEAREKLGVDRVKTLPKNRWVRFMDSKKNESLRQACAAV